MEMKKFEEIKNIVLENDYDEAQRILNLGDYTNFDALSLYNERVGSDEFNKVFKIAIERQEDYHRFLYVLANEKINMKVSFDVWRSGRLPNGQRLGKALRKAGASQTLLDFYSAQIKTEKEVILVITDKVQFITGMSYYSTGDWDGMEGKSCQCPAIGGSYAKRLAGALHDDKLYVAFIIEKLEDLEDMEGKMLARTVMRLIHIDGEACLVATRYYGNNKTKDWLDKALKAVEGHCPIFSRDVLTGIDIERVVEPANGEATIYTIKDIHIYEDQTYWVDIDCPYCDGDGKITVYDDMDNEHEIDCPHCNGYGTVETEHYIHIDEWREIETEEAITPYDEDYSHYGDEVLIYLNTEYIKKKLYEYEEV